MVGKNPGAFSLNPSSPDLSSVHSLKPVLIGGGYSQEVIDSLASPVSFVVFMARYLNN